ncbi:MAG: IS4 family transposase [Ignavibacteriaceae bacterium]
MVNVTLFSQIIHNLDRKVFSKAVANYGTDKHNKGINSWTHLVTMLFLHLSKSQSIREVTNGLLSISGNLNHLGIQRKSPSKSSLSYINAHRDWQMFREYYYMVFEQLQQQGYFKRKKFKGIQKKIYLLDSTVISLCLEIFDWAKYRHEKGAIKLHTMLDYDGCLPKYVFMTEGRQADVKHAQYMLMPRGSVIVADRGYQDFEMMYDWHKQQITFVIRLKQRINYEHVKELQLSTNKDQHILKDELIRLKEEDSAGKYPDILRLVSVYDEKNNKVIEVLTNNLTWTASTIAELYKQRWMIEIFFKELKQHLKIKSFIGTNENAMYIQIWTALISLLILKYLKEIAKFSWSLSNLIAFLRMNLFVKIELNEWLNNPFRPQNQFSAENLQGKLF